MSILKFSVRVARKTAHVGNKLLAKGSRIANKVEDKATRILDGVDYSISINEKIPLEKIYYNSIPYVLPIHASMPAVGSKPTVTLLIPSLDGNSFFGGTATALVVAGKMAIKLNRKLRIVQTLKTGSAGNLSSFFSQEGMKLTEENIQVISIAERAYDRYGYISMHQDDIFIASAWWDAHNLLNMPLQQKFIYLVQDFEPIFYNNSDQYILAEETYKKEGSYIPLCNTEIMAEFMKERQYPSFSNPIFFEPAVSRINSGKKIIKGSKGKKVLFLYGRPNVHRNMFFSAIEAINLAFKNGYLDNSEWECYMAGQDNIPDIQLPSGGVIKNKGKMSMQEYIEFSKTVDIAVSPMMAPHPNYPTLEFASIGSMVVTTKYANKQSLSKYSDNIIMSDISSLSMAGAIKQAASVSAKQQEVSFKNTSISNSWDTSLDKPIEKILLSLK